MTIATATRYVLCLDNEGYEASLVRRKLYRLISDEMASSRGLLRVVDESGEDYLFPATLFSPVQIPAEAAALLAREGGESWRRVERGREGHALRGLPLRYEEPFEPVAAGDWDAAR